MAVSEILTVIYSCIRELNKQIPEKQRLETVPSTMLTGEGGQLDSLNLINLLVMIEEAVEHQLKVSVVLLDEAQIAAEAGPFRTVGTLAEWIATKG